MRHFVLVTVAALGMATLFLLLRPDEGDDPGKPTAPGQRTGPAPESPTQPGSSTAPERPARPETVRIRVRNGKPVGGVRRISAKRGETVRLAVSSSDTSDEVHVHGYDLTKDLAPGRTVRFRFKADLEGIYEVELEQAKVPLAELRVRP